MANMFFRYALAVFISSFKNSLFRLRVHFKLGCFFIDSSISSYLSDAQLAKMLSQSLGFPWTWLIISLVVHTLFSFMGAHLLIAGPNSWANRVLFFKKSFSLPTSCRIFPMFPSRNFSISDFAWGLLSIYSWFLWGVIDMGLILFFHVWPPSFLLNYK